MKKILLEAIIIACIGFLLSSCAVSNTTSSSGGLSKNDWKEFSQTVSKIYIWTHVSADKYFYYKTAQATIEQKLQGLGYQTEILDYTFDSRRIDDWKQGGSLENGEAFIELTTNKQGTTIRTKGTATASIKLYYNSPTRRMVVTHSNSETNKKNDILLAVNYAAGYIPKKGY